MFFFSYKERVIICLYSARICVNIINPEDGLRFMTQYASTLLETVRTEYN